ncbi:14401_t:CDS:1, partial [Cetraspora pellucida]
YLVKKLHFVDEENELASEAQKDKFMPIQTQKSVNMLLKQKSTEHISTY